MVKRFDKRKLNIFFGILILFCCVFFSCFYINVNAHAKVNFISSTRTSEINTSNYYLFDLDSNMFNALCAIEHEIRGNGDTKDSAFNSDFFSVGYKEAVPTSSDGVAIKNDLTQGVLYLVTGNNAKYECLKGLGSLENIEGLNNIDFSGVNELVLTGNSINQISELDLESFTTLTKLSAENNELTSIDLSPELQSRLVELNLSNNILTSLDISRVGNQANVNLSSNNLTGLGSLSGNLGTLNIGFNNITNVNELNIIRNTAGCSPLIFVQGLGDVSIAGDKILVDSTHYNLQATLEYSYESMFAGEEIVLNTQSNFCEIYMPAGYVTLSFEYAENMPINVSSLLDDREYTLKLDMPQVTAMSNGNTITNFESTQSMYFTFSINLNENIANYQDILSNATLYSGIGENIGEGEQIAIEENGDYTLRSYVVFDNIQSDVISINVSKNDYSGVTWALIIIVGIVVIIASLWFIIRWFRNGAVVAPLSDREIARLNRKKEIRESGKYYSYSFEKEKDLEGHDDDLVDLSDDDTNDLENGDLDLNNGEGEDDEKY